MNRRAVQISLFLLLSQPLFGQWIPDPDANTPLCTEVNDQTNAQLAKSSNGDVIYVWQDQRQGSLTATDIYAQRFDSLGMQQWGAQGTSICSLTGVQYQVRVIPDGVGGAYLTWNDLGRGISVQRIDSDGNRFWAEQGIIVKSGIQPFAFPRFVSDSSDGVIVTWTDNRNGKKGVYAQRINGQGIALWNSQGVRLKNSPNAQNQPQIVSDNRGGAYVVWMESSVGIFAQAINPDGSLRWANEGRIVCGVSNGNENPRIVADENDGLIVVWEDWRTGSESNVYAQRIDYFPGNSLWDAEGKAVCTASGNQSGLDILWDPAGYSVLGWKDERTNAPGLYMQSLDLNGAANWQANGIPVCTVQGSNPSGLRLATDDSGGAYAVWVDQRNVPTGQDLYVQRINPNGNPVWLAGGLPLANSVGNQSDSRIVDNGIGGAVVVWEDRTNGQSSDLYTMGLRKEGLIPVELSHFTARMIDSHVLLRWATESEQNNFGFYIQRSQDAQRWSTAGFVAGQGSTVSSNNYQFVDHLEFPDGEWFYRLKQIDFDGSVTYSSVLSVSNLVAGIATIRSVYPQPADVSATATFSIPDDATVTMYLYNSLGKRVETIIAGASLLPGSYVQSFDISSLPSGVYQLRLESPHYLQSIPLIVR